VIDLDATVLAAADDAFGEWALWTPVGGIAWRVPVKFFDNAKDVRFQDGAEVVEITPQISIRLSQWPGQPAQRDALLLRGIAYVITEVHPDGVGAAMCRLRWRTDAQASVAPLPPDPVSQ